MLRDKPVILVTGSGGFIGSALVTRLAEDYTTVGFDRALNTHPPIVAECVCIDLTDDKSMERGFGRLRHAYGDRLASVIHLSAYYDFSGEPSPMYDEVTVEGTRRLLRGLRDFQVEQFIFSSTMLVNAPTEPGVPINEDSRIEPRWPYPESKVKTEQVIREEHGDIPYVILRIAGVYDDVCHSPPLSHQIQRIFERQLTSYVFPGDKTHGQSFLHLDDLVVAFRLLADRSGDIPRETVLLLGEPETLSYDELQRTIGSLLHGEEWETREIPEALARAGAWLQDAVPFGDDPFIKPRMIGFADDHYELDISRARQLLGWEPKRSLSETLPKMVDALKRDPVAWYSANKLAAPAGLEQRRPVGVSG